MSARANSPTRAEGVWVPAVEVPLWLHNGWRVAVLEDGPVYDAREALLVAPAAGKAAG